MSYRLKFDERVDKLWRRIVHEQIDTALALLAEGKNVPVAVHETRKSMKRVRALLKLLRTGLSREDYKKENSRFGDIARHLSDARDAEVLALTALQIAEVTTGKTRAAALEMAKEARATAQAHAGDGAGKKSTSARPGHRLPEQAVGKAIKALKAAKKTVDDVELRSTSFAVVREGLATSYRRGRRAMKRSYESNHDEEFHEWRKWVQAHWRHMWLFSRAWPDHFAARMQLAKEMSDLLGADHDLYMLIVAVKQRRERGARAAGVDGLLRAARRRQGEIREALQAKSAVLYAEETADFVARIETYWEAARAEQKRQRKSDRLRREAVKTASDASAAIVDEAAVAEMTAIKSPIAVAAAKSIKKANSATVDQASKAIRKPASKAIAKTTRAAKPGAKAARKPRRPVTVRS